MDNLDFFYFSGAKCFLPKEATHKAQIFILFNHGINQNRGGAKGRRQRKLVGSGVLQSRRPLPPSDRYGPQTIFC